MTLEKLAASHWMDVCECGDYRYQHDERGHCRFNKPNGIGHGGAPDCVEFRLCVIENMPKDLSDGLPHLNRNE